MRVSVIVPGYYIDKMVILATPVSSKAEGTEAGQCPKISSTLFIEHA